MDDPLTELERRARQDRERLARIESALTPLRR